MENYLEEIERQKKRQAEAIIKGQDPQFYLLAEAIKKYYCYSQLKLYCQELGGKKEIKRVKGFEDINSIIEIYKNRYRNQKLIELYYKLYLLLLEKNNNREWKGEGLLQYIKEVDEARLTVVNKALPKDDAIIIYNIASGLMIPLINRTLDFELNYFLVNIILFNLNYKNRSDFKMGFNVFNNMINTALYYRNNSLFIKKIMNKHSPIYLKHFRKGKIIKDGLDWAFLFINLYKLTKKELENISSLSPVKKKRYNRYLYAKAYIYYKTGSLLNAYDTIKEVTDGKKGVFIYLEARLLKIRILMDWELYPPQNINLRKLNINSHDELEKTLEAFRVSLEQKNRKESTVEIEIYKNIYKCYRKLYSFNFKHTILNKKAKKNERSELEEFFKIHGEAYTNLLLKHLTSIKN